jgi:hypothetical protein
MIRNALIVSNPGELGAQNYCEGVKVDVQNYISFLKSPLGGGWLEEEITHLSRPSCNDLDSYISKLAIYDYSFIAFCGHGFHSAQRGSTMLELKKGHEFDSLSLRNNANKRTIILDCCRKVERDLIAESAVIAKFAEAREALSFAECRRYFEVQVDKCANGIVVGYACSKNETAGDSQSNGGYYSHSLMKSATSWHEKDKTDLTKQYSYHTIVSAHNIAVPIVKQLSGGNQNPEIDKPRSEPYFPFAIIA